MLAHRHWVLACLASLTLAGCASRMVEQPPTMSAPSATRIPAGAAVYEVVPAETEVTVLVYRAGPLARFGHNHAVASTLEQGRVWIGASVEECGFEIRVPVAVMSVDDPAVRAAAGSDFAGEVPEDARLGTRQNMLRPEVLDAERYPEIRVQSVGISGSLQQPLVRAAVTLRGATREIEMPVAVKVAGPRLEASGSLQLRQAEFGITPFSVAGGAVQVADEFEVRFRIVAAR